MTKKILIIGCLVIVLGLGAFAWAVAAPRRQALDCLTQLKGVRVSRTTEADLLSRPFFQKSARLCTNNVCSYSLFATNTWLSLVHLAPATEIGVIVQVKDGLVFHVWVFGNIFFKDSISSVTLDQVPAGSSCGPRPCVTRDYRTKDRYSSHSISAVKVTFDENSDVSDQLSTGVNVSCLSRLRGCSSADELLPLAGRLGGSAAQPQPKANP
jgi:hypothetical protein